MGLNLSEASKEQYVDVILANEVYLPESGLIRNLKARLLKLSKNDLSDLHLIIELKIQDASAGTSVLSSIEERQ